MRTMLLLLTLGSFAMAQDLGGDLSLHRLLIPGEEWKVVAEGLGFADGPATDADGNFYFSDMKAPGIYRIGLDGAKTQLAAEPASGLKFGPDGRLYACQGSKKRIVAIEVRKPGEPAIEVLAEDVQPNDLVVTRTGQLYFTETGKKQVTRIELASKQVSVADTGITAPNGIALSPDEGTLAVSDYRGGYAWTFRVEPNGSLTAKAPIMTLRRPVNTAGEFKFNEPPPLKAESGGDGMCCDVTGRFFITSSMGVQVFDPTGRECGLLPKPQADRPLTSCVLAGEGRAFLYITNGDKIFRRKVQAVLAK